MMRSAVFVLALAGTLLACERLLAASRGQIIPETTAIRHGLARPWFTQVQVDQARGRITHIVLDAGTLFVQTDQSVLHAVDAETGQTLWAEQIGRRGHPSLPAAASEYFVAVVNGSYLYVANRQNGKVLWRTQLKGAPGAGAALSDERVYVPMLDGLVYSYLLEPMEDPREELGIIQQQELTPEEEEAREAERRESIQIKQEFVAPLVCQSFGRSMVQPIVTHRTEDEDYLAWPTDRGLLFVATVVRLEEKFLVRYRLETGAAIAAQPTYLPPNPNVVADSGVIFVASRDGFVHALAEKPGTHLWRFSTAEPILQPPVPVEGSVFVVTQPGGMYCVDAKTGLETWFAYQIDQFIAASKDRIYAVDKLDRIVVLNAATGARLDTIPARGMDIKLLNMQTDRIYLASRTGLIQCLHEVGLPEPIRHNQVPEAAPAAAPPAGEKAAPQPKAKQPPAAGEDPFRPAGAADEADPFRGAAAGPGQDNPFGAAGANPFN